MSLFRIIKHYESVFFSSWYSDAVYSSMQQNRSSAQKKIRNNCIERKISQPFDFFNSGIDNGILKSS
jgi:hypothetical protein